MRKQKAGRSQTTSTKFYGNTSTSTKGMRVVKSNRMGYTPFQVRKALDSRVWDMFLRFMHGQTYAFDDVTGTPYYYVDDVQKFVRGLKDTALVTD